ncbi:MULTISPECIES: hypothetical protein [Candidatus Cardinium]|uniref:hypothetical protein n=1 Tax=Candidatus Cardinium TaxID=273135 RepID=UPI001FAAC319|nr:MULTISPECIES: hypothetical protein [Cardinium]
MKTYTRYRAGLFAGVLILHTLSACVNVHTRKELGYSIPAKLQECYQATQGLYQRTYQGAQRCYK